MRNRMNGIFFGILLVLAGCIAVCAGGESSRAAEKTYVDEGSISSGEITDDSAWEDMDEGPAMNPQIETDSSDESEEGEFDEDLGSYEENSDLIGAQSDQESEEDDSSDVGTAVNTQAYGFPLWLTIVLIVVGVLIPVVTIVLKRIIDKK